MSTQEGAQENQLDRLRAIADSLDMILETDLMLLAKCTHSTVEAWRKRGMGPAYVLLGNRYLYPRKVLSAYLDGLTKERSNAVASAAL